MSEVGWISGSLEERNAAEEFLGRSADADPRDELGIGTLRDSISDALFPGVTTQQTRAKYFLFGPLICRKLERRRSRRSAWELIRDEETEVLAALEKGPDHRGVIGSKRWRIPGRGPTSIYWQGFHTWSLRTEEVSLPRYVAWLGGSRKLERRLLTDESELEQDLSLWDSQLDEFADALDTPNLALMSAEAGYLRDCILRIADVSGRSLLKDLAAARTRSLTYDLWDLSIVRSNRAAMAQLVADSRELSVAIQGAMLLYNHLCAVQRDDASTDYWANECEDWRAENPSARWDRWNLKAALDRFSELAGGANGVKSSGGFLAKWHERLRESKEASMHADQAAIRIVRWREREVKGRRARLLGGPALATWDPRGLGVGQIQFRWRQARRILGDIGDGLKT